MDKTEEAKLTSVVMQSQEWLSEEALAAPGAHTDEVAAAIDRLRNFADSVDALNVLKTARLAPGPDREYLYWQGQMLSYMARDLAGDMESDLGLAGVGSEVFPVTHEGHA